MQLQNNRRFVNNDGTKERLAFWSEMPLGLTWEMLELTGFIKPFHREENEIYVNEESVKRIFGGRLRFREPRDKNTRRNLDRVIVDLHTILQIKTKSMYHVNQINRLLTLPYGVSDSMPDISGLPDKFQKRIIKLFTAKEVFPFASREDTVRKLRALKWEYEQHYNDPGHYSGIFTVANAVFSKMLIDTTTVSMENMMVKPVEQPVVDSLDVDAYVEAEQEGVWR